MKRLYILFFLMFVVTSESAADVVIKADAPSTVEVGEEFSLKYTVSTRDVDNFVGPKFPQAIRVLYDLARSEMSSYQMINGKASSTSSVTFTYTLCAEKAGTYKIPTAMVTIKGKNYNTRTVTIQVLNASKSSSSQSPRNSQSQSINPTGKISGKDLFIAVSANKTNIYEQEPIVLTYKIYTRVNLTQLAGKMPDLKGFLIQEVPTPRQKTFSVEQYNGENYNTTVWCQYVMFPQMSGKLTIPSIKFDGVVAVANPNIDPFDAFFNGNTNFAEVKKSIIAPSLNIDVKKLPTPKPSDFSGAVGKFDIGMEMLTETPRTNENLSVRITITGTGNMKLITAPKLNLGTDFDVYTPKLTDNTKLTTEGIKGTLVYDYVIVPKQQGKYMLPPIDFVYFDPSEKTYKTSSTSSIEFRVGHGTTAAHSDNNNLNGDINDIHTGEPAFLSKYFYFGNITYYISYLCIFVVFVILFVLLKRSERFKNDTTLQMRRKAKRLADVHIKNAQKLLATNETREFYNELTSAAQTYISNRLNIPMSDFQSEYIAGKLQDNGVSKELSSELVDVISQCEFARYAPGDPRENKENLFQRTSDIIIKIEKVLNESNVL